VNPFGGEKSFQNLRRRSGRDDAGGGGEEAGRHGHGSRLTVVVKSLGDEQVIYSWRERFHHGWAVQYFFLAADEGGGTKG
jgi:hypothetical protein